MGLGRKGVITAVLAAAILAGCSGKADAPDLPDVAEAQTAPLEADGFSIEMPGEAERTTREVKTPAGPTLHLVIYSAEGGSDALTVMVTRYPAELPFDLDTAAHGAGLNIGGVVDQVTKLQIQGYPARDLRISGVVRDGRELIMFGRVVATQDGRLFQLFYGKSGDAAGAKETFTRFASTFQIDDRAPV